MARLSPKNATGGSDLYSQNFSWGTSLVNLPGRAGMNAGFGVSYNSLVWTKSGSEIYFDADTSNISPGFRFGFPTIEPAYFDQKTSRFAYLMVTPSGGRVEFRQIGASNVYETADSSYVQLKTNGASSPNDPVEAISITLTGTDGTQLSYEWKGGAFHCKEIKDRNGNYITITHDAYGFLQTVTDTLGRVITVNYDSASYPLSVTQTWKSGNGDGSNVTHTWASLSYTTVPVSTNFDGSLAVIGPPNGTVLKVLDKVTYADNSFTQFDYNGYGQVWKVRNYAADNHQLNYVRTNLEVPNLNQFDCPKFTETRSWVENFNGGNETVVTNVITPNTNYSLPGGLSGTAAMIDVWMTGHPNNAVSKTYVAETGWKEGLPVATEDYADGQRKRWTWTNYTQDDTNLNYILNPRVIESRVGDTVNIKKTAVEYLPVSVGSPVALYGLVKKAEVFDSGLSTVIKRAETDYNLSTTYTDRRIIGLPLETRAFGVPASAGVFSGALDLVSRMTYVYDGGDFSDAALSQNISPVQHDNTTYGSAFIIGRGNVTSTTRYDVLGQSSPVTSSVKYNTAGAPVSQISPGSATGTTREVRIGYADSFNTTGNPATYAYPTTLTDPANNSSTVKYRYDIGANVWAKSPDLNAQTPGKQTEREYDTFGRLSKDKIVNLGGAYTRYEYPSNGIQSKVFSTIIDTNSNNVGDTADEVLSESWADGAGRVRRSRTPHTFDTSGNPLNWAGTIVEYDILGRVKRSTVPTETDSSWQPAGDDNRGLDGSGNPVWLWNSQEYDWKGRVTREINTDGTDRLMTYEGCGCAGGLVTTVQSEVIVDGHFDGNPNTLGRRTVKSYADLLGRTYKAEALLWNGNLYSTTVMEFNGRDQVVRTKQTDNTSTATPQPFQEVTTTYDGHGRMKTRHYPVEDANTNTSWAYNADDSVQQVIDPRGVTASYTYNDPRGLPTGISYTVPQGSSIPVTPSVAFAYDALGNRTSMNDGTGTTSYNYDQLSRISSEVRAFIGVTGSFTIAYTYHLAGGLKSIYDPGDATRTIDYGYDRTGSLTSVAANGSFVLQNRKVRAFGGVKQEDYAGGLNLRQEFDTRLRISQYDVKNASQQSQLKVDYTYNAANQVDRANNVTSANFDRDYSYDHMGRLVSNETKWTGGTAYAAYSASAGYDVWNNLTHRTSGIWGYVTIASSNYQNNRSMSSSEWNSYTASSATENWQYNAAGMATQTGPQTHQYDAAGRKIESLETPTPPTPGTLGRTELLIQQNYDGNGEIVKRFERETFNIGSPGLSTKYSLRSTVLGGAVLSQIEQGVRGGDTIYEPSGMKAGFIAAPFTGSSPGSESDPFGTGIPTDPPPVEPAAGLAFPGLVPGSCEPFRRERRMLLAWIPDRLLRACPIPEHRRSAHNERHLSELRPRTWSVVIARPTSTARKRRAKF